MEIKTSSDYLISQMRVLDIREMTFFYVANQPTAFANLERDLDPLLESLEEARALAHIPQAGPDIVRYYQVDPGAQGDGSELYRMEVGNPVRAGTLPAGKAQVKELPGFHCAGVLLWGSLAHIRQAYEALMAALKEAGLEQTGETREWNYFFESVGSPNNLMGIYMGINEKEPGQ